MPNLPAVPARGSPYSGGEGESSGESRTGLPLVDNPGRFDAFNWMRRILRFEPHAAPRREIQHTSDALHTGAEPDRVPRTVFLGRGLTGPNIDVLPLMGSWAYIPGQNINVKDGGKAVLSVRLSDDSVTVPAIYAGNPNAGS